MAIIMKWGKSDCMIDIFGDDIHEKINWLKGSKHDELLVWVASLTECERLNLFRDTVKGQGFVKVDIAQPGDAAIGVFSMGINVGYELPKPWFAQMGIDHLWYVRMPRSIRVVDYLGTIEIYRCPQ